MFSAVSSWQPLHHCSIYNILSNVCISLNMYPKNFPAPGRTKEVRPDQIGSAV